MSMKKKNIPIQVNISTEMDMLLREKAARVNMTKSDFVRTLLEHTELTALALKDMKIPGTQLVKNAQVNLRISPELQMKIIKAAKRCRLIISDYIRTIIANGDISLKCEVTLKGQKQIETFGEYRHSAC